MTSTAVIFPGQGAQYLGMGHDVFDRYPEYVDQADQLLGYAIRELCARDSDSLLSQTQYTQPAIFIVSALSYMKYREEEGGKVDFLLGHSVGEIAALFAAECIDFKSALKLICERGKLMAEAINGGMCAVLGPHVEELLLLLPSVAPELDLANLNSDSQIVLSGPVGVFARLEELAEERDWHVVRLKVGGAFHSRYMESAAHGFGAFLRTIEFHPPKMPVISNVTGLPYPSEADEIRGMLTRQLIQPVRWADSVRFLRKIGCTNFIELGPGTVLTRMMAHIQ